MHEPADAPMRDVEAAFVASRALLAVVARTLMGALEEVSLPQFRVLVVLRSRAAVRASDLADIMGANRSTFSRFTDRLVDLGYVRRQPQPEDRREVLIELTERGRALVDDVVDLRHRELAAILGRLSERERRTVREGLALFAVAAGEPAPGELLTLGL